ncbi:MAG: HAD family hydrolase [Pseudomonadota bacterium]
MRSIELVIFDCDGVLVDSEMITNRVFCEMLNELGVEVTLEDMFERFVGHSMATCIEIITELRGCPPPDGFVKRLRHKAGAALQAEVEAVPGVSDVVDSLNIPYCVASSGEPAKIRLTLGKTGLLGRFEQKIFSVVDVARPKPEPDIFLHAASEMGVAPSACAVIEDTPTGVSAGVAAGMYVYGFAAHTPSRRLLDAGAHEVFSKMSALPASLAQHCKSST